MPCQKQLFLRKYHGHGDKGRSSQDEMAHRLKLLPWKLTNRGNCYCLKQPEPDLILILSENNTFFVELLVIIDFQVVIVK